MSTNEDKAGDTSPNGRVTNEVLLGEFRAEAMLAKVRFEDTRTRQREIIVTLNDHKNTLDSHGARIDGHDGDIQDIRSGRASSLQIWLLIASVAVGEILLSLLVIKIWMR